jgi:hypothetical protein
LPALDCFRLAPGQNRPGVMGNNWFQKQKREKIMTIYSPDKINELYLDWFNNFLTIERFAEYYGIRKQTAEYIIRAGRIANHKTEGKKS